MNTSRIDEYIGKHLDGKGNLKMIKGWERHSAWLSINEWPGERKAYARFLKYWLAGLSVTTIFKHCPWTEK